MLAFSSSMSYLYENYIYPNKLTNRMKITLIRAEKESGKEALSTLEADALIKKLKTETKAGHVSTLRAILPQLEGTCAQYEHIDLKSATKLFSVLLASKRPLITELADKLRLKYPLLPTISPCPTMRLEAIRSIIPISCRRYPKSV